MKQRSVPAVIILPLVTLGIYQLFWLYDTREEMVKRKQYIPAFSILLLPVAALIFVIVFQLFAHIILNGDGGSAALTTLNVVSVIAGVVGFIGIIPIALWWTYHYCRAVEGVTKGQTTFAFAFGMLLVLTLIGFPFIWPGLVQDGFNKVPN